MKAEWIKIFYFNFRGFFFRKSHSPELFNTVTSSIFLSLLFLEIDFADLY